MIATHIIDSATEAYVPQHDRVNPPVWIIYRPGMLDNPTDWSARLCLIGVETEYVLSGPTLEDVRDKLTPGLKRLYSSRFVGTMIEEIWA